MSYKKEIVICLGSSCFSRGNKKVLAVINSYITEHNLQERVYFHGAHCYGSCDQGPIVKIGENKYTAVTPTNIYDILEKEFNI